MTLLGAVVEPVGVVTDPEEGEGGPEEVGTLHQDTEDVAPTAAIAQDGEVLRVQPVAEVGREEFAGGPDVARLPAGTVPSAGGAPTAAKVQAGRDDAVATGEPASNVNHRRPVGALRVAVHHHQERERPVQPRVRDESVQRLCPVQGVPVRKRLFGNVRFGHAAWVSGSATALRLRSGC